MPLLRAKQYGQITGGRLRISSFTACCEQQGTGNRFVGARARAAAAAARARAAWTQLCRVVGCRWRSSSSNAALGSRSPAGHWLASCGSRQDTASGGTNRAAQVRRASRGRRPLHACERQGPALTPRTGPVLQSAGQPAIFQPVTPASVVKRAPSSASRCRSRSHEA